MNTIHLLLYGAYYTHLLCGAIYKYEGLLYSLRLRRQQKITPCLTHFAAQELQEREARTEEERGRRRELRQVQTRRMLVQTATKAVVNEAVKRGSSDNVSAVLVMIAST